jgi:hypothetical protein
MARVECWMFSRISTSMVKRCGQDQYPRRRSDSAAQTPKIGRLRMGSLARTLHNRCSTLLLQGNALM